MRKSPRDKAQRETLCAAARAVGVRLVDGFYDCSGNAALTDNARIWNPLYRTDDSSHLEAELMINIEWRKEDVLARRGDVVMVVRYDQHDGNRDRARMHASTLVAAALADQDAA